MRGTIIYYNSDAFKRNETKKIFVFKKEKKNYYNLNELLEILNSLLIKASQKVPLEIIKYFIKMLFNKGILKRQDVEIFEAYFKDLNYIGYNYSLCSFSDINYNYKNLLNVYSQLTLYKQSNLFVMR